MPKLTRIKSVDRNNNIQFFESIAQAAEYHKCDESSIRKALDKSHRYSCGRSWHTVDDHNISDAKILILDIETSPILAWVWRLWDQNISLDQIESDFFILSWAAKWLGSEKCYSEVLTSEEVTNERDARIMKSLWILLDDADVVIAHYGDKFDMPKIRGRFVENGLMPPSSYKQIDTRKIASKEFGFSSNKLEALARKFGISGKNDTDFSLWKRCMRGDSNALEYMRTYNEQDVFILEEVYIALRPYIKGHPNLDLYIDSDKPVCPSCGFDTLVPIPEKFFYTQAVRYQLYRCTNCGAISRAKKGTPYIHKKQISAIPR